MFSILIPTYNCVCVELVKDLQRQAERTKLPYEIIVADDASKETVKQVNRQINVFPHCRYIELKENMGRARIRNLLGEQAQYDTLIFIDSDAAVISNDFLANYLHVRKEKVVYGGLVHPASLPSPDVTLAYKYEKRAEPRFTLEKREQKPYEVFRTFNFMVQRSVFLAHPFDERIVNYGHEDTLFGRALRMDGIEILHIDNPLMNSGLDNNSNVLHKTEESLRTLYDLRNELSDSSALLKFYHRLKRMKLVSIVSFLFRLSYPILRYNLLSTHPSLHVFAFYKIGYYCQLARKANRLSKA